LYVTYSEENIILKIVASHSASEKREMW